MVKHRQQPRIKLTLSQDERSRLDAQAARREIPSATLAVDLIVRALPALEADPAPVSQRTARSARSTRPTRPARKPSKATASQPKPVQLSETTPETPDHGKSPVNAIPELEDIAEFERLRDQLLSQPVNPNPRDPDPVTPPARPIVPSTTPVVPGATFEPDPLAAPFSSLDKFRKMETDAKKKFDINDLAELPNMQF
jgi:hypothetical protein